MSGSGGTDRVGRPAGSRLTASRLLPEYLLRPLFPFPFSRSSDLGRAPAHAAPEPIGYRSLSRWTAGETIPRSGPFIARSRWPDVSGPTDGSPGLRPAARRVERRRRPPRRSPGRHHQFPPWLRGSGRVSAASRRTWIGRVATGSHGSPGHIHRSIRKCHRPSGVIGKPMTFPTGGEGRGSVADFRNRLSPRGPGPARVVRDSSRWGTSSPRSRAGWGCGGRTSARTVG